MNRILDADRFIEGLKSVDRTLGLHGLLPMLIQMVEHCVIQTQSDEDFVLCISCKKRCKFALLDGLSGCSE